MRLRTYQAPPFIGKADVQGCLFRSDLNGLDILRVYCKMYRFDPICLL